MPLRLDEKLLILEVAKGPGASSDYADSRDAAVTAHRRVQAEPGYLQTPEGRFMSELDSPCPDLALRAKYRSALLQE